MSSGKAYDSGSTRLAMVITLSNRLKVISLPFFIHLFRIAKPATATMVPIILAARMVHKLMTG